MKLNNKEASMHKLDKEDTLNVCEQCGVVFCVEFVHKIVVSEHGKEVLHAMCPVCGLCKYRDS
jgi:hypothetical protein